MDSSITGILWGLYQDSEASGFKQKAHMGQIWIMEALYLTCVIVAFS